MSTALYRRYRPETFAEVIGQDHVTAPLMQALRSGRVNHAYLFSGPRGCGKTTSARILARTLNCARNTDANPLDTPCGECPSCVDLARGGPGSLDVVEIDAASHGGVDDARDLRERATFAPTRDRFKIFIIDEAHMVSPAGFNALLKIVEEPPEHVKFVFATTEPDKVIGTIRSRTHHYPFRLVPPDVLGPYLEELCTAEGVAVGQGVFPLVTRAGGGSVRDSLSVMDQLIAGAENGQVDYERAVALLGFTHGTLLDDVVDALAARDGASIFRVVDHVVATGHEPRRFVEDVLERLRDLIVIAVSGDEAQAVLRDQPADQLARMRTQAQNLGVAELSRAADLVNAALTEMTGATSPRLHLELLVARLLLPGADDGAAGFAARLDRLERGGLGGAPAGAPAAPAPAASAAVPVGASARPVPDAAPAAPAVTAPSSALSGPAAVRAALGRRAPTETVVPDAVATPAVAVVPDAAAVQAGTDEPAATDGPAVADVPTVADVPAASDEPATADTGDAADTAETVDEPRQVEPAAALAAAGSDAPEDPASEASSHEADGEVAQPVSVEHEPQPEPQREPQPEPGPAVEQGAGSSAAAAPAMTTEDLRRRWPEVLETLSANRVTWSLVSTNAQVSELRSDVLFLAFPSAGLARAFSSARHTGAVQDAVYQTLGLQVRVEPRLDEGGPGGGSVQSTGNDPATPDPAGPAAPSPVPSGGSGTTGPGTPGARPPGSGTAVPQAAGSSVVGSVPSAGTSAPGPRAAVALQERPAPAPDSTAPSTAPRGAVVDAADEAWLAGAPAVVAPVRAARVESMPAPTAGGAETADEAWLAGALPPEPTADLDPPDIVPPDIDPPDIDPPDPAPSWSAGVSPGSSPGPVGEPRAGGDPAQSGNPAGTTRTVPPLSGASAARAAASAAIASARDVARSGSARRAPDAGTRVPGSAPDPMEDLPSADDPDIVATGLVGTALVVNLLGGTIIEEIQGQGA
ncbi:DNA polymerase III subunit gamma and tau [Cellulosimicrobium marinum]|uniref:DNA polymerase III subunit gamma and tau n=1 Tax=Cellulosimicrobium marinum TaxID=1638992 RepID=UPI001E49C10E|nr:DNA polymerase III subunit gamma and tau [Cellulosimicrobium marinum]MCB7136249.1 DNA polymerase III subunit gamma and tau [Cellulosimicrobium marinum]